MGFALWDSNLRLDGKMMFSFDVSIMVLLLLSGSGGSGFVARARERDTSPRFVKGVWTIGVMMIEEFIMRKLVRFLA